MALELKREQVVPSRRKLAMTPQLQQAIKILRLSLPEPEALGQMTPVGTGSPRANKRPRG
ncbi:MAG TPA: hypothetical protein VGG60_00285 [Candidatus Binataceae bacterium]|jgi:hypothetical protein